MEHSDDMKELAAAMVAAQGEITGAAKDATNPHFRTKYADLSSVMEACKGALNKHGIAVLQSPAPSEVGTVCIDTVLLHKSGQWASGRMVIPIAKHDPQGFGSGLTYARRYALAAMVGVTPEDDDGEGAMNRAPARPQQQQRPAPRPAPPVKPVDMDDVEKFSVLMGEALESRGFDASGWDRVKVAACKSKKVNGIAALTNEQRDGLLAAIAAGKFDHLKEGVNV